LHQLFHLHGFSSEEQGKEFIAGFFSGKKGIGTICASLKLYGDEDSVGGKDAGHADGQSGKRRRESAVKTGKPISGNDKEDAR